MHRLTQVLSYRFISVHMIRLYMCVFIQLTAINSHICVNMVFTQLFDLIMLFKHDILKVLLLLVVHPSHVNSHRVNSG